MNEALKRKENIYTAQMNGETVMMDAQSGKYYNLGEIGGRIWALLETPMTADELAEKLITEYKVTKEKCLEDIAPFIEKMKKDGLIK